MPTECLLCVFKLFSLSFYVIKAEGVGFGLDWGFFVLWCFFCLGFFVFCGFFFSSSFIIRMSEFFM